MANQPQLAELLISGQVTLADPMVLRFEAQQPTQGTAVWLRLRQSIKNGFSLSCSFRLTSGDSDKM